MCELRVGLLCLEMQRLFKEYIDLQSGIKLCFDDERYTVDVLGSNSFVERISSNMNFIDGFHDSFENKIGNKSSVKEILLKGALHAESFVFVMSATDHLFKIKTDCLNEEIKEMSNHSEEIDKDIEVIPLAFEELKNDISIALEDFFSRSNAVLNNVTLKHFEFFKNMLDGLKEEVDSLISFNSLDNRDKFFELVGYDSRSVNIIVYSKLDFERVILSVKNILETIFDDLEMKLYDEIISEVNVFNKKFVELFEGFSNKIIRSSYTSGFCLDDFEFILEKYKLMRSLVFECLDELFKDSRSFKVDNKINHILITRGFFSRLLGGRRKQELEERKLYEDISAFDECFIIDIEGFKNIFSYIVIDILKDVNQAIQDKSNQQVNGFASDLLEVIQPCLDELSNESLDYWNDIKEDFNELDELSLLERNMYYFVKDIKSLKDDINNVQCWGGAVQ